MEENNSLKLFENKNIRVAWNDKKEILLKKKKKY